MGECLLVRRGGGKATLKGISVKTPPTKLEYVAGEAFDSTGLVLTALIGGLEVDIATGYTVTPAIISDNTTYVTISYTLDGKTATTAQAVTVLFADSTLANNTIESIATIAAIGSAANIWSVGDQMVIPISGVNYTAKIMGFNLHDLDATDAKYNDANYNKGRKKAGITFMFTTLFPIQKMNTSDTNAGGWGNTYMRNTVLPSIKSSLPSGYAGAIRTVSIPYAAGYQANTISYAADSLFLPSYYELEGNKWASTPNEGEQFPYFTAGNAKGFQTADGKDKKWWTRTCNISADSTFVGWNDDRGIYTNFYATVLNPQLVCFCV